MIDPLAALHHCGGAGGGDMNFRVGRLRRECWRAWAAAALLLVSACTHDVTPQGCPPTLSEPSDIPNPPQSKLEGTEDNDGRRWLFSTGCGVPSSLIEPVEDRSDDLIPFIPWPPPQSSSRADITSKVPAARRSQGEIADDLRRRLASRGYSDFYFFAVQTGGFVLITRAERIDDRGEPLQKDRWLTSKQTASLTAGDYIHKLFHGDDGRIRVLVFVVSAHQFHEGGPATNEDIKRWRSTGQPKLPASAERQAVPRTASVTLLVYEFRLDHQEAKILEAASNALPVRDHLASLGLAP